MSATDVCDAIEEMAERVSKKGDRETARGRVSARHRQARMLDAPPAGGWQFVPDNKKDAAAPLLTPSRVWACVLAVILLVVVGLAVHHSPGATGLQEGGEEVVDEEPVFEVGDHSHEYEEEKEEAQPEPVAAAAAEEEEEEDSVGADEPAPELGSLANSIATEGEGAEGDASEPEPAELNVGVEAEELNVSEPAEDDGSNATLSEAFTSLKAPELFAAGCIPKHIRKSRNGQATIAREVVQYTISAIKNTPVETMPYQHMFVKTVFEPTFYKCILSHIPAGKDATGLKRLRGSRSTRFTIPIARGKGHSVDTEHGAEIGINTAFWNAFSKAFGTEEVSLLWLEKFKKTTARRFKSSGVLPPWAPGSRASYTYEMDLSRDLTGYAINPHTDSANKLVTTLFYLPKTNALANTGTLLVKSTSGKISKAGSGRTSWSGMEVAKQAQFLPNSLMAFAPCMSSWHAVKKTTDEHLARDSIQGFVHINSKTALKKGQCGV